MQTCSKCQTQSPDSIKICPTCQADLSEFSNTAVSLKRLCENPRVRAIRISVPENACPICQNAQGSYHKDNVPTLPLPGCSEPNGCLAFYEPVLGEIYP